MENHPYFIDSLKAPPYFKEMCRHIELIRPEIAAIQDPGEKCMAVNDFLMKLPDPEEFIQKFIDGNPQKFESFISQFASAMKSSPESTEQIKALPMQDTLWLIEQIDAPDIGTDENGEVCRYMNVFDRIGLHLGVNMANPEESSFSEQAFNLVCHAALHPMAKVARRPRYVSFKDPVLAQKHPLDLGKLGITFLSQHNVSDSDMGGYIRWRECCFCRMRGTRDLFKKCSSCQAMLYCCKDCQKADWNRSGDMEEHAHRKWCSRLKVFMSRTEELTKFPFTFTEETTSPDFDSWQYKQFLEKHGVYNQGLWRRECIVWMQPGKFPQFGKLDNTDNPYVLPVETVVLEDRPSSPVPPLPDWDSYYTYRGFKLDSPIAVLLHYPLTLYHIIANCLPKLYANVWDDIQKSKTINVDMLGVEKEVEMLQLFEETGKLLPDLTLDIHMYGNEMTKALCGVKKDLGNVKISIHRQLYHKKVGDQKNREPHLAVGFNSGLGAYPDWARTMQKLKDNLIPAYFTDYCQYSCQCANVAMTILQLGSVAEPAINPFRNPIRKVCEENDMPWYSNGFLYRLVY